MLTPLDVENKRFSKQMMNGYNVEEVDDFLDEIGADYAQKNRELQEKDKELENLKREVEKYKSLESTLQNTLVMAQSTAEEVKNVAKQQADQLVADAKSTVEREVIDLEQKVTYKKRELDNLQKQFDIYKAKMESLLISQLELIKEVNKDN
ncbi:MAG: DivIVA domain-containing protein [Clostridia bacterium]|nr:DivIVA domain-containing protein [Clostridia bacterium]